ncbi:LON peptidase substrate-binding domain-containing protein [Ferrovibrio terrae]|uniref:LON peptidase substrate-binding domain-containing protein n=1 Tax=Ferrovibrio terrae TaxID=2594003 RepID=UPI0031381FE8
MHESQCPASIDELSRTIPIFPLNGVLLLPRGLLPLNIFEPRYLAMTRAALDGAKLIGMIQPTQSEGLPGQSPRNGADLYTTGCVGKIVSATESDDGRILLTLRGLCRFQVARELEAGTAYRQVEADYAEYAADMTAAQDGLCERDRLIHALRAYCARHNLPADWDSITAVNDDLLVHSLAMICPFSAGEKQALLEAPDFKARAAMLVSLLEMALLDGSILPRGAKPN